MAEAPPTKESTTRLLADAGEKQPADLQPTVYESEEAVPQEGPIPDAPTNSPTKSTEAIVSPEELDTNGLDLANARAAFKGKLLYASTSTDFSDSLEGGEPGYISVDGNAGPTIAQRFTKLQEEIAELLEEAQATGQMVSKAGDAAQKPAQLVDQVRRLQEQLQQAQRDHLLGPNAPDDTTRALLAEISRHRNRYAAEPVTAHTVADKAVTYELHMRSDHTQFLAAARLQDLAARLARIEAAIGAAPTAPAASVTACLADLASKVHALSDDGLIDMDRRVAQFDAAKRQPAPAESENAARINSLHELVAKYNHVAESLPALVERLKVLRPLHERGAAASLAVARLDESQQQLAESAAVQGAALTKLEQSFAVNSAAIDANVASLTHRLDALKSKMATLK
eukprot:m.201578 g.201578  ORF g.201578 m.201578 type:complete len:399 (+) comp15507_c3_seq1:17-1213(+)